jgi:outer membrane lipoprotein-sorting protein
MRTIRHTLLTLLTVFVLSTAAVAANFEGEIHVKITVPKLEQPLEQLMFVKGDTFRQEMDTPFGRKFISIFNAGKKTWIMLNPESKTYTEWSLDDEGRSADSAMKKYVFERTGKSETIAGYGCDVVLVKEKETGALHSEVCIHKGLGGFLWSGGMNQSKSEQTFKSWMYDLMKDGGFPLRMTTRKDDGTEEMRMDVTQVEKKRLENSLFAVPAGYTKRDSSMMQGLRQGGAGSQGAVDIEKMMREAREKKAARGGTANATDGNKPNAQDFDVNSFMKNLGDMMKKKQGGQ